MINWEYTKLTKLEQWVCHEPFHIQLLRKSGNAGELDLWKAVVYGQEIDTNKIMNESEAKVWAIAHARNVLQVIRLQLESEMQHDKSNV